MLQPTNGVDYKYPALLRTLANIISYVFHPLFVPIYITWFLIEIHPYLFAGMNAWERFTDLMQVAINCTFLPLVAVLLLRGLKFIDSIHLHSQKDRIIPYVISMIFYFWNWYAFKNTRSPSEVVELSLSIFIASIVGFIANIYLKVSMHAIAMGVLVVFIGDLALEDSSYLVVYLVLAVIIAGLVCSSRLIVSDHSTKEVYVGLLLGGVSVIAANVVG